MIRSFVALALSTEMTSALETLQADLTIGNLVAAENFHLTLAFLGDQSRPVLEDLHLALEAIMVEPIDVALSGIGLFGGREPRTIHAKVQRSEPLKRLRDKVHRAIQEVGIKSDSRRFHPHVTLSRLATLEFEEKLRLEAWTARHAGFAFGPSVLSSFGLYRSTLTKGGPIYDQMAKYSLR
ncbi:MAG: RNA 2',3'-cyclic phosphodiesterase [Pseudomonadota bacterium]